MTNHPLKIYKGNCHCGAFKFRVQIPELATVTECNCSICFRKGYKWIFPNPDSFTIEKGEGGLREYKAGSAVHKASLPYPSRYQFEQRLKRQLTRGSSVRYAELEL
jgi:hypothetical protein